ncbi:hypothetical protein HAX54_048237, partial [Datura stramonium]|nr:hypothetical protein [Datura stramonium]
RKMIILGLFVLPLWLAVCTKLIPSRICEYLMPRVNQAMGQTRRLKATYGFDDFLRVKVEACTCEDGRHA